MKNRLFVIICAALLIISALWCAVSVLRPKKAARVDITSDGKLLYSLDLSKEKDRTFDIEYDGGKNTVEIKNGRICVSDADCPDKLCVKTGWLSDIPIVCLPHRLMISLSQGGGADAVAG